MTEPIKIDNTGEMIAAIPAMLGFVPSQSVVLVFLAGNRESHIARMDFGEMDHPLVTAATSCSNDTDGVYVVVVAENRTFREVLDESERVIAMLLGAGADVHGSFYTPSIHGGETWTDMRGLFETGTVPDPATTQVGAATVFNGRTVARNRSEITARYRRNDSVTVAERRRARAEKETMGDQFASSIIRELAGLVSTRTIPDAALAARVGLLLTTDIHARDAILGLAVIDPNVASEMMEVIASKLRTRERVAALTISGFFAYVNFQGPAARSAFTAARQEATQHPLCDTRMLGLLEQALTAGLHPTAIRKLAGTGVGIAREKFHVELPAPGGDWT
jgi:hypothetical protein